MEGSLNSNDLPRLTRSSTLERDDEPGLARRFLLSAAYTGAEAPIRALAQAADHVAGSNLDANVQSGFQTIGLEQPKPVEFGTGAWYSQQLGSALGMAVPFLALRGAVKAGATGLLGEELVSGSLEAGSQTLAQMAKREAMLSGATGFVYGSVFSPSKESNVGSVSFLADRLKNGLSDMATFAALGYGGTYIGAGLESAASTLERSALPAALASPFSSTMRLPIVIGMTAGLPGGVVNAEANALKTGRLLPTGQELKESVVGMVFVGGALAAAGQLAERVTENKNISTPAERDIAVRASAARSQAELEQAIQAAIKRLAQEPAAADVPQFSLMDTIARATVTGEKALVSDAAIEKAAAASSAIDKAAATSSAIERAAEQKTVISPAKDAAGKVSDNLKTVDPNLPGLDIVLGASGIEAPAHAGFLQAIEDSKVPVRTITGASGGSLVAALYANKYTPGQIKDILLSDSFRYPDPVVMAECLHVGEPWKLYPYAMDFRPWVQNFVDTYHLKPQPNLRIVAADKITKAPVVFEGTSINLVDAITASTAATTGLNMKPLSYNGRDLIDGFYYHPTPAALTKAPAIVSKIGFVKELPRDVLTPWDYFMHLREMSYYNDFVARYPDPPGHIIAQTGLPDVATTTFSVSKETLEKLVEHGYDATMERLKQPDAQQAIEAARRSTQK